MGQVILSLQVYATYLALLLIRVGHDADAAEGAVTRHMRNCVSLKCYSVQGRGTSVATLPPLAQVTCDKEDQFQLWRKDMGNGSIFQLFNVGSGKCATSKNFDPIIGGDLVIDNCRQRDDNQAFDSTFVKWNPKIMGMERFMIYRSEFLGGGPKPSMTPNLTISVSDGKLDVNGAHLVLRKFKIDNDNQLVEWPTKDQL